MRTEDLDADVRAHRTTDHEISPLILNRWSPRAMTGEPVALDDLRAVFEAARWAPSAGNNQPWRYVYARRDTPEWTSFFDLLSEGNQRWAGEAGALVIVLSMTTYEDSDDPLRNHSFSNGASWQNLALEGTRRGLAVHPMQGFDEEAARRLLSLPDDVRVEIMTAIGVHGAPERLSERDRDREIPKGRKPIEAIAFEGAFEG